MAFTDEDLKRLRGTTNDPRYAESVWNLKALLARLEAGEALANRAYCGCGDKCFCGIAALVETFSKSKGWKRDE